ncbi:helix-turn-helix domain-containing protein [Alicyclobacillus pomorum]|uniref:helix-turn-helix domain-containing protein n=1 Tax=Alicyclobacillus pomorum TaxID=204470 RepID=UPI00040D0B4F|nr:helix-turn-helix transcriptional regulator [Alicyclobacillus pomorum]
MAISYLPLEILLIKRGLNRERLIEAGVVSRPTVAKFRRGDYVSLEIIDRLCTHLDCRIDEVVAYVKEEVVEYVNNDGQS